MAAVLPAINAYAVSQSSKRCASLPGDALPETQSAPFRSINKGSSPAASALSDTYKRPAPRDLLQICEKYH